MFLVKARSACLRGLWLGDIQDTRRVDNPEGVAGLNLVGADFNGDGLIDLASTPNATVDEVLGHEGEGNSLLADAAIAVYLNTSTSGGLAAQATAVRVLNSYGRPGALAAGDFNLDGEVDLVAGFATREGRAYGIAYGDGAGSFPSASVHIGFTDQADPIKNSGWGARTVTAVAAGDFDGNGQPDVAVTANDHRESPAGSRLEGMSLYGVSYNHTFNAVGGSVGLPDGRQGMAYAGAISGTGGDPGLPYTMALSALSAPLPPGLSLAADGAVSGVPTRSGSYTMLVEITQSNGMKGSVLVPLRIAVGDTYAPSVEDIGSVTPSPRNTPVDSVVVRFSEALDPASFTEADLRLTRDGQPVALQGVSLSSSNNRVFSIGGLSALTTAVGAYELTVDARGVQDASGNAGVNEMSVDFVRTDFESILTLTDDGRWVLSKSDGTQFQTSIFGRWATDVTWTSILEGDVNGDGLSDVIGRTDIGQWWATINNGDGLTDIAGRAADGQWWGMYSNGSTSSRTNLTIGQWDSTAVWAGVVSGDANGDGRSDIVGRNAPTPLSARGRFSTSLNGTGVLVTQAWGSINTPAAVEARAVFFSRF